MSASTAFNHPKARTHRRRFSASHSLSSSSIDTVIPRGPSPNASAARSRAAQTGNQHTGGRGSSTEPRRLSGVADVPLYVNSGGKDAPTGANRWSQSTTSSVSSGPNQRGSLSKRLSLGGHNAFGPFSGLGRSQSPPRNFLDKTRPWTAGSPQGRPSPPLTQATTSRPSTQPSATTSPQIVDSPSFLNGGPPPSFGLPPPSVLPVSTLPALTQATNACDTPSTESATPTTAALLASSHPASQPDYFGQGWGGASPSKQMSSAQKVPVQQLPLQQGMHNQVEPLGHHRTTTSSDSGKSHHVDTHGSGTSHHVDSHGSKDRLKARSRRRSGQNHSRNRDDAGKGSGSTQHSNSSVRSSRDRDRDRDTRDRQPSQKAMLSKALQKANTAVLLDNEKNYEVAVDAYGDACALLQQVMNRSSGDDDKRKLETIRATYTHRVEELRALLFGNNAAGKALPARPQSDATSQSRDSARSLLSDVHPDTAIIETATVATIANDQAYVTDPRISRTLAPMHVPQRRESLMPSAINGQEHFDALAVQQSAPRRARTETPTPESPARAQIVETSLNLRVPMDSEYMPPPLSPRRPLSPAVQGSPGRGDGPPIAEIRLTLPPLLPSPKKHSRNNSSESTSWLDTIDESAGSSGSSVHSHSSSTGLRRKHIRAASGDTEAEFDAALDAAVEAAYDDGLEPAVNESPKTVSSVSDARKNVELAKERVREAEIEAAIIFAKGRDKRRLQDLNYHQRSDSIDVDYQESEAEEEERMLEEMTRDYVMDDFEFDLQSKSALPRESDSSGFSGRTWGSSIGSNPTTAGTSLQTLTEAPSLPALPSDLQSKQPPPKHPPPSSNLPAPPSFKTSTSHVPPSGTGSLGAPGLVDPLSQGVRSRRLSGQVSKQLKIETSTKLPPNALPPITQPPPIPGSMSSKDNSIPPAPKSAGLLSTINNAVAGSQQPTLLPLSATRQASSPLPGPSPADSTTGPDLSKTVSNDSDMSPPALPFVESPHHLHKVSTAPSTLRKNFSSSSLKNRNLNVPTPDGSEVSPSTPLSTTFAAAVTNLRKGYPLVPALPTPTASSFAIGNPAPGGLNLFDSDIHSPCSPGSPNQLAVNAPAPLEPCPSEHVLRPFWLMRCFYQTIAHPRGGYVSTKLFVPRDVWMVKGVKLKALEEKVSNSDFLTAALLKLGRVDTCDADAVLEELQAFEQVLEPVQQMLTKKLGNEVGVQGSSTLFKDAAGGGDTGSTTEANAAKTPAQPSKASYLSWKRLRSKNSGAGLTNAFTGPKDGPKDTISMSTLPMSSVSTMKPPKRHVDQLEFNGPNALYMGALARLFDAAQVLDQIARQAEDPGLKHSSTTQVGIELSTRRAAEFFAFYICRFALADISMMLDKFIKRGSEWVLV
ncbi:MAG: hypothetical protein M1833_000342 [Piccolia ochrophora]|nr:MAG: hypothetical protein M1833_000342 [Piccolia ochrophora]